MNMDIDFECTMCGKCCHDLRLPLTATEAVEWLQRGGQLQIICEALPWPVEPPPDNLQLAHKRRRSFAAMSGSLPVRIVVILAGTYVGPCPNLLADMRCAIYEERPLVCRIYPAEINPFTELVPANKGCPPEAWTPGLPSLARAGRLVDADMLALIQRSHEADANDLPLKQQLCARLGIDQAALTNEGFVVHSPDQAGLLAALLDMRDEPAAASPVLPSWQVMSNRRATVDTLVSVDAHSALVDASHATAFEYLGYFADSV
jgi:Fe-S-cluster containining protein